MDLRMLRRRSRGRGGDERGERQRLGERFQKLLGFGDVHFDQAVNRERSPPGPQCGDDHVSMGGKGRSMPCSTSLRSGCAGSSYRHALSRIPDRSRGQGQRSPARYASCRDLGDSK